MSDELVIDLSNYKDRVGTRVIPGTYRVQVEDVELTESSNKNPMVNIWFTCLDGEFQGQTLTDRLVLTEKSMFRVVGFMQAIGLPTPKKKLKLNIRQFIGRVLDVEVDDGEPYNGRIRSEVRGYKKVPGAAAGSDIEDEANEVTPQAATPTPVGVQGSDPIDSGTGTTAAVTDSADDSLDLDSVSL